MRLPLMLTLLIYVVFNVTIKADELKLHIASYHSEMDGSPTKKINDKYNESNLGLGYKTNLNECFTTEAGVYRNSYSNISAYVAIGHDFKDILGVTPNISMFVMSGYEDSPMNYKGFVIAPRLSLTYKFLELGGTPNYTKDVYLNNQKEVMAVNARPTLIYTLSLVQRF